MGIFDLATDIFSGDWSGLGSDLMAGFLSPGPATSSATSLMPTYSFGEQSQSPQVIQVANPSNLPARARAAGLPGWAGRFPSLWQYLQTHMLGSGAVGGLLSALSKWGPTAMSTIVGAAVVSDLIQYKVARKRRRMNPANTRALRRSLRRLKSFDRLAHRVQSQLHRGGRRGPSKSRRTIVTGNRSVVAD